MVGVRVGENCNSLDVFNKTISPLALFGYDI